MLRHRKTGEGECSSDEEHNKRRKEVRENEVTREQETREETSEAEAELTAEVPVRRDQVIKIQSILNAFIMLIQVLSSRLQKYKNTSLDISYL